MQEHLEKLKAQIYEIMSDDQHRQYFSTKYTCLLLCIISAVMTVVNIFTGKTLLMVSTLVFSVLNLLNFLLINEKPKRVNICNILVCAETLLLFNFFLISGEPEGFAVQWITLLGPFALLLFGLKMGSVTCLTELAVLVFMLWTPTGRQIMVHPEVYSNSFHLRYPFLYLAGFLLSLFFEWILTLAQKELKKSRGEFAYLYTHDALTGLDNRYGLEQHMSHWNKGPVSVMMLDLDHFKEINDTYGHASGDEVLKATGKLLQKTLRISDEIARWGGEEFVVVLQGTPIPERAAQKILDAFRSTDIELADGKGTVRITMSIGIAHAADGLIADPQEMLRQADIKLYEAKQKGRNKYVR